MNQVFKVYVWLVLGFASPIAFAESASLTPKNTKHFLLGYSQNHPVFNSREIYTSSIFHPILGVRYMTEDWVLGVSVHFKFLKNKLDESKLVLWTLQEELNYRIRLYHPFYLLAGAKLLYLYPVQRGSYPFRKVEDFGGAELGVGASLSLLYFFPKDLALGAFADLWRGTGSRKYEALEVGMHLSFPVPF